jgi:hypothetical protein
VIIGITGKARSGKDTIAGMIAKSTRSTDVAAFADPMKQMLSLGLGIDPSVLYDPMKDSEYLDYDCSPRHMMQTLATEWGREVVHPDIWVKALDKSIEYSTYDHTVISDVRFDNEAEYCRKKGVLIHIIGRGGIKGDHKSEKGVTLKPQDLFILNNGTLKDLERCVREELLNLKLPLYESN